MDAGYVVVGYLEAWSGIVVSPNHTRSLSIACHAELQLEKNGIWLNDLRLWRHGIDCPLQVLPVLAIID